MLVNYILVPIPNKYSTFFIILYRVGKQDLRQKFEKYEKTHRAVKVISHSQFSRKHSINDIALIKVTPPIQFNNGVQPVCIPRTPPVEHKNCSITGESSTKLLQAVEFM